MTGPMEKDFIVVRGAREHNLKNISVEIPVHQITVVTGLSGSGKSTLAFDTIYAEGQRRYIESLSAYARQFLEQLKKPEVDSITGLSPAIAIDQKSVGTNPRSTVGTVSEIYDFLRLLFARLGAPYCPTHGIPLQAQSIEDAMKMCRNFSPKTPFYVLAPVISGKKGEFLAEFQRWNRKGILKAKVDGKFIELERATKLKKTLQHDIDLVIDQLVVKPGIEARLQKSIEDALVHSENKFAVETTEGVRRVFRLDASCPECGFSAPELEPRLFSYNNPRGACPECNGVGSVENLEELDTDDDSEVVEIRSERCSVCLGKRLRPEALSVLFHGKNIYELGEFGCEKLTQWVSELVLTPREQIIAEKIVIELKRKLNYLLKVGLGYLNLNRSVRTLSGGEAQRIRLATQVSSALIGILYVLDEPSIGLHPRDQDRFLNILFELRDRGNTILLVEHDEETIWAADYVLDLGPRAGKLGGEVMSRGTPQQIAQDKKSLTGLYLSGARTVGDINSQRAGNGFEIEIFGARGNNLKNVDVKFPLGKFIAVTGVSGSGKSTLVVDTLYPILARHFELLAPEPGDHDKVRGLEHVDKVVEINQKPIGRTPRSTPSTYVGLFPLIRDLYSAVPESKMRGYKPGRFSFNVKSGRCEVCEGYGQIRMEMNFLADVFVPCHGCNGARFNKETLQIRYKGKSIADVLDMTVEEGLEFFQNFPTVRRKLETLHRVGLDYLHLGQSSTTLSGGEAQRIKLAKELSRRSTGKTFYILDEPTTGLHFEDVRNLTELLHELVSQGNTVLVIEHHLDLISTADHVIDLGPDGGDRGGEIVAVGTPDDICKVTQSETGQFLKKLKSKSRTSAPQAGQPITHPAPMST